MNLLWKSFLILLILIAACSPKSEEKTVAEPMEEVSNQDLSSPPQNSNTEIPMGDTSQTSLDWNGTYTGTIPCGHCEGITVWLTLRLDETFEFKTSYLGLNDARDEIFTGKFTWDASGSQIQLQGLIGDYPGKFFVGENQIWYLDAEGKKFTGPNAENYLLKKI